MKMDPVSIAALLSYLITQGFLTYVQVNKTLQQLKAQGALTQDQVDLILDDLSETVDSIMGKWEVDNA